MPHPMTPLDETLTERRPRILQPRTARRGIPQYSDAFRRALAAEGVPPGLPSQPRTTRPEIWLAVSADHRWTYRRLEETSTPWEVTYLPTGQGARFTTLTEGRRWTAMPLAFAQLRARARDVIDRGGRSDTIVLIPGPGGHTRRAAEEEKRVTDRLRLAMRAAAVLDGALVTAEPQARCEQGGPAGVCGGYLAEAGGAWVHVDACRECYEGPVAERRACHNLAGHLACGDAHPLLCGHPRCGKPAELEPGRCPRGRDACCEACCYVLDGSVS